MVAKELHSCDPEQSTLTKTWLLKPSGLFQSRTTSHDTYVLPRSQLAQMPAGEKQPAGGLLVVFKCRLEG